MARKKSNNRPNLPKTALAQARREASGEVAAVQPMQHAASAGAFVKTTMDDLANEYSYVVTDLRNMGILAAVLFILLVVIALMG